MARYACRRGNEILVAATGSELARTQDAASIFFFPGLRPFLGRTGGCPSLVWRFSFFTAVAFCLSGTLQSASDRAKITSKRHIYFKISSFSSLTFCEIRQIKNLFSFFLGESEGVAPFSMEPFQKCAPPRSCRANYPMPPLFGHVL